MPYVSSKCNSYIVLTEENRAIGKRHYRERGSYNSIEVKNSLDIMQISLSNIGNDD